MLLDLPPPKCLAIANNNGCINGNPIAYIHSSGQSPGIFYLPGFMSSIKSFKSRSLYNHCCKHDLEFTTFEYSQDDNRIGCWSDQAISVLNNVPRAQHQILVGSSMGAWIMMLMTQNDLVVPSIDGLLGIASAPDFTQVMENTIRSNQTLTEQLLSNGYCDVTSAYSDSGYYRIHQDFLDESKKHFILDNEGSFQLEQIPVRLIHGLKDDDVHYSQSQRLLSKIESTNKQLIVVDGGDHRLSKPRELDIILSALHSIVTVAKNVQRSE